MARFDRMAVLNEMLQAGLLLIWVQEVRNA